MQAIEEGVNFEEVLDSEINELWEIFFPYMAEKKEKHKKGSTGLKSKSHRHLKFLTI